MKKKKLIKTKKTKQHLTHLIYCDKHGFALYREAIDYSALPIASCGCFPSKTLNLKEVIEIVGKIRHANWNKSLRFKDLHFYIVGYRNHFWPLQNLKYKISTFWYNLTHLFSERD